ncbi:MAG TPA: ATP-grasp domain-containing protein [bacterium]|nr:ATP-grasp domain-containing protein [bacterium]
MILGAGIMQLPAVRLAKAKGWRVVVAAKDICPEIEALADLTLPVDLRDKEAMVEAALSIDKIDGVFTAGTDFSTTVAWVAESLDLPGIPYDNALAATNKSIMRQKFARYGVASPSFISVTKAERIEEKLGSLHYPMVVKPVDNMGARGVRRVDHKDELERAIDSAVTQSRTGEVIIEQYLEGPELSLDAIVFRGRVTICGVADRHICFPPHFVEMGHTMPTAMAPNSIRAAEKVFKSGIRALGIGNGAAKGDIIITSTGPVVGEIAARLSGGYMSGWTHPLSSGIEVTAAALNVAMGLPPGALRPIYTAASAERAFISIPGRVQSITGLDEALHHTFVEELFVRTAAGADVVFPTNNLEKCGNVISKAFSRSEAVSAAEEAVRKITIRLEADRKETELFLFGDGHSPAFAAGPDTWKAVREMPPFRGSLEALRRGGEGLAVLPADIPGGLSPDWHGLDLGQALSRLSAVTGLELFQPGPAKIILGRAFWIALLRGSVQGALYFFDTLLKNRNRPEKAKELFSKT